MTRHLLLPLDLGLLLATSLFHTASGARVILGPEIGRGGEGSVYEVVGAPDLVAKVYTDGRADDRREKIEAMAAAGLHRQASHISFPIDVLLGDKGTFVGFTMRRIKGALPIHQLWGSRDRQDKFPDATVAFMVRVAGNAARAVGELHQAGCVIGDINESGFLVTDQATVVLIDSDSIQVTVGNRVFPCVVGTPQYLPPEHQSVNQRQLGPRAANHDNFGLAVLIFRLLMAGTHPFMGRWNGPGDPPALPKWIEEFRYAYGTDAARMKVGPQPAAPPIDWLSDEIRAAFNQAFGKSGVQARPTAADWIGVLDQFEKTLMACGRSRYHHHRPGVRSCPWCETEKTRGKALFGPPTPPPPPHFQQTPFSVPPPGPTPSAPSTTPPATPINALRNTALAIVGVTIAAIWMFGGGETTTRQPPEGQARISPAPVVTSAEIWTRATNASSPMSTFGQRTSGIVLETRLIGTELPPQDFQVVIRYPNGDRSICTDLTCHVNKYQIRTVVFAPPFNSEDRVEEIFQTGSYSATVMISGDALARTEFRVTKEAPRIDTKPEPQTQPLETAEPDAPSRSSSLSVFEQIGGAVWIGPVSQPSSNTRYSMRLRIEAGKIRVDYPELSCGGYWDLVETNGSTSKFRERIDYGQGRCVNNGYVLVEARNAAEIFFEWSRRENRTREGWATLRQE